MRKGCRKLNEFQYYEDMINNSLFSDFAEEYEPTINNKYILKNEQAEIQLQIITEKRPSITPFLPPDFVQECFLEYVEGKQYDNLEFINMNTEVAD